MAMTFEQAETQLENRIRELTSKLSMLRTLRRQLNGTQEVQEPVRKKRQYRGRRHTDATQRVIAALATVKFPVTSKQLRKRTKLPSSTVGSVLANKVKDGYLKKLRLGVYDKGPLFDALSSEKSGGTKNAAI